MEKTLTHEQILSLCDVQADLGMFLSEIANDEATINSPHPDELLKNVQDAFDSVSSILKEVLENVDS